MKWVVHNIITFQPYPSSLSLFRALYFVFCVMVTWTLFFVFQIVSAVQYCHQKHVIHRDLKVLFVIIIKAKKIILFLGDFISIDAFVELCLRLNVDRSIWNILFSLTFSFSDMYMTLLNRCCWINLWSQATINYWITLFLWQHFLVWLLCKNIIILIVLSSILFLSFAGRKFTFRWRHEH